MPRRWYEILSGKDYDKRLNYINLFLLLLPVFLAFFYVFLFGVNGVFGDQWNIVYLFQKVFSGTITVSELFAQHNEHRIFFPLIFMLLLGVITHYNNIVEMYSIVVFLSLSWIILLSGIKELFNNKLIRVTAICIPVTFLIFTWRQCTNMLAGFQITYAFAHTFSLLSLYLVYRFIRSDKRGMRVTYLILSMAGAVIASFSSAMGLVVWIAGLSMLAAGTPEHRRKIGWPTAVWIAAGALSWLLYFINYHSPTVSARFGGVFNFIDMPFKAALYFFTLCGGWFTWNTLLSMIAGIVILALFFLSLFFVYGTGRVKENLFWIGTGLFSLFTMAAITAGRYNEGNTQALSSRYVTFSVLMVIAVYVMLADLSVHKQNKQSKYMVLLVLFMIITSIPVSFFYGSLVGKKDMLQREKDACILYNYRSSDDRSLLELYPLAHAVKHWAGILQRLDYNVFYYNPVYTYNCDKMSIKE
ncbi:MAG: hypothetical protein M1381_10465 [Deltaproteobacteria bacterium]|nr:hypothetical protein [Deltaproteobacteria bacterium]MCL5792683.1 hypothetical protein [Deltaproteobacteria bacterium]